MDYLNKNGAGGHFGIFESQIPLTTASGDRLARATQRARLPSNDAAQRPHAQCKRRTMALLSRPKRSANERRDLLATFRDPGRLGFSLTDNNVAQRSK
jgi:hypothetical protein